MESPTSNPTRYFIALASIRRGDIISGVNDAPGKSSWPVEARGMGIGGDGDGSGGTYTAGVMVKVCDASGGPPKCAKIVEAVLDAVQKSVVTMDWDNDGSTKMATTAVMMVPRVADAAFAAGALISRAVEVAKKLSSLLEARKGREVLK
ncbi:uncharacterized protein ARMOST_07660 [Armillaria ostoyae]|uniref:Uncharacterized protein n=1 Tax=Armillaria ostoyae TaxID=47428 RepID=A0A284R6I5_ARMOS|nr:uncharacterized protein ARMOST_07660 [Armillaria ostoyae]